MLCVNIAVWDFEENLFFCLEKPDAVGVDGCDLSNIVSGYCFVLFTQHQRGLCAASALSIFVSFGSPIRTSHSNIS